MNVRVIKYIPIKILLAFLVFTELLVFIGPYEIDIEYPFVLCTYFIILNVALYRGYKRGVINKRIVLDDKSHKRYVPLKMIIFFLILGFISIIIRGSKFGLSSLPERIVMGIINSGEAYYNQPEWAGDASFYTYLVLLLEPMKLGAMCLGVYYWKDLPKKVRLFVVLLLLFDTLLWICIGTRKGIFDVLIIVFVAICASRPEIFVVKKYKRRLNLSIIIGLGLFLTYFVVSNVSRFGFDDISDMQERFKIKPFYEKYTAPWFYYSFANIEGYLCQGYRALSKALNSFLFEGCVPWSMGLGNSWFPINVMEKIDPEIDILSHTYLHTLEADGIHPTQNWHSLYVWLANDVTFLGVPIVIYYVGRLLGNTWIDAVNGRNVYSIPLCVLVFMIVVYAYANNQVLSFSFIAFAFYLYFYWIKRRRLNGRKSVLLG